MGASPLFPLFMAIFFLGIAALGQNYYETTRSQTFAVADTALTASAFLHYRSAVMAYIEANPGWTGHVPAAWLTNLGISATTQQLISHQVITSTAGRQLLIYADMPGNGYEIYKQAEGDASIGTALEGRFVSFNTSSQGTPVALPIAVPNRYVVSFIEVGH
jgi:hypothetical protein